MSTSVLHPSAFLETSGGCSGPQNIRNQPSRETPGTLLNSVTNKYVTEFTVPFRNSVRSLKTFKLNWDKISSEDQEKIKAMIGPMDAPTVEQMVNSTLTSNDIDSNGKILALSSFLDKIKNPDQQMKTMYSEQELSSLNSELNMWSAKTFWYVILITVMLVIVVIMLLVKNPSSVAF